MLARRPDTAFVLAGGASLGALQVGMLGALYERGIRPDLLVGTSAGALNAAYIASRPPTLETVAELARIWRALRREDVFPMHAPGLLAGLFGRRDHVAEQRPLRELVSRHLELESLEQARVPLHVVTFDLLSGEEVRLCEGPALGAVLAASAVPGVLPPVRWGSRVLVDAGVVNNTPISHAVQLGAKRIYVLPTQDPRDRSLARRPRGALDAALHAFTLLADARLPGDLARYGAAAQLILLPAANACDVAPTDFGQADRLIGSAFRASLSALDHAPIQRVLAA
jgi:NTE family protein